jgi:hypothetical protein
MGFLERFKAARAVQQEAKGLSSADTAGKEAEKRGGQKRKEAGEYLEQKGRDARDLVKGVLEAAGNRVSGLWQKIKDGGSALRRGTGQALDRAIGTPGLMIDVYGAGKEAAGETIKAGVKSADVGATKLFTELGTGAGQLVLAVERSLSGLKKQGKETLQEVGKGVEQGAERVVKSGSELWKGIRTGVEGGVIELAKVIGKKVTSVETAVVVALQKTVSPERLAQIDPDNIKALSKALAEQGVDVASAKGNEIITKIGQRWDKGVETVSYGLSEVDKGMSELVDHAETEITNAKNKLVDRANAAKNKFLGWWNKSRIQDARINKLEEQNAQLLTLVESQNALLSELASARPPRLERKTGEPFSMKETAS